MKKILIRNLILSVIIGNCFSGTVEASYISPPDGENLPSSESHRPEVNFIDDKLDIVDTAYNASVGVEKPVVYYNFNYSNIKIDDNKLRGNDMVLGSALTKGNNEKKDTITQGPFFEYGDGRYNNDKYTYYDEKGDIKKYGVGYLFRQVKNGQHHFDAYIRTGKISNDFRSVTLGGFTTKYDNDTNFYAAHLGYGQYLPIDPYTTLDVYGKYYYKNISGSNTKLHTQYFPDENLEFDALNTHKFRIGGKITWDYMKKNKAMMYADLALEHELSYTQNVTYWGHTSGITSGADTTGVLELGYRKVFGPNDAFLFTADLQGYVGTRSGLGGNIGVRFNF